ncbi:MAG: hypothetical protein EBU92_10510, partial [Betaproteobacteria bacterium]|nr:hypothetical protein [Betaproteobacteria bacterium]
RMDMGHDDINPTLADIERTHLLFMNATFKPFAAFGFEYQRVQPTGSIAYGSTLKYSIPQAGDFFADMGVLFTTSAATYGGTAFASGATNQVTAGGALILANDSTLTPFIRYCDFPGERIVSQGKFTVNSNTLHEYDHHASAFWRKFKLPATKEIAYNRMVGQEIPQSVESTTLVDATGLNTAAAAAILDPGLLAMSGATTTVAKTTTHRLKYEMVNGLQTPKSSQPAASFWHKCQFWFNKDPRLMVPSVSIPYGQRFVELTLCTQKQLLRVVGGDSADTTFGATTRDTTHYTRQFVTAATADVGGWAANTGIILQAKDIITATSARETITGGALSTADLYVNNVYVLPDIHDIYIHRIGFNLIRVTRSHSVSVTASSTPEQQLHQLKWPIEAVYFGVQADACVDDLDCWWRMGNPTHEMGASWAILDDGGAANAATTQPYHFINEGTRTMTAVTVSLHGTKVYDAMDPTFFSDYMPATFGGSNVSCSVDRNSHALFFGFYPGTYQPSGHVNISRARELYFKWTQSAVAGTFYAVADAINFLLISDGNAILRYTT